MLIEECDGVNGLLLIGNVIEDALWLPEVRTDSSDRNSVCTSENFFIVFSIRFWRYLIPHYAVMFRAKFWFEIWKILSGRISLIELLSYLLYEKYVNVKCGLKIIILQKVFLISPNLGCWMMIYSKCSFYKNMKHRINLL